MKRLTVLILLMLIPAVLLSSCAKPNKALTAEELLDLGEKYLMDMDYEQALVKFLEAIEVEPKNPRGYLGAAEAYAGLGQTDKAIEILQKGLEEIPENEELQRMLNELEQSAAGDDEAGPAEDNNPESSACEDEDKQSITVTGVIFSNYETYQAKYENYCAQYQTENVFVSIYSYGVRFNEPVVVNSDDGTAVTLSESVLGSEFEYEEILSLYGKRLVMTGYFRFIGEDELIGPEEYENGRMGYIYNPNGGYRFWMQSYSIIDD